jgi:hypothetical protein
MLGTNTRVTGRVPEGFTPHHENHQPWTVSVTSPGGKLHLNLILTSNTTSGFSSKKEK